LKTAISSSWPEPFIGPNNPFNRERQIWFAGAVMLKDRENILNALREKPLKAYQVMRRANLPNEEACQSLLLKMRDEGLVKFDIHKGHWLIG
jgi:hypothetical protein